LSEQSPPKDKWRSAGADIGGRGWLTEPEGEALSGRYYHVAGR